jgi:hypothetical protein
MECNCGFCIAVAGPWSAKPDHIYPVTIVHARYGGTYEGGVWLAFPVDPDVLGTTNWNGGDIECLEFFLDHTHIPIGRGSNLNEALSDMTQRICDPDDDFTKWVRQVRRGK